MAIATASDSQSGDCCLLVGLLLEMSCYIYTRVRTALHHTCPPFCSPYWPFHRNYCSVPCLNSAQLCMDTGHAPTATASLQEDALRVHVDLCVHKNCSAATLKHGTLGFERGWLNIEGEGGGGGAQHMVCRFGESLAYYWHLYYMYQGIIYLVSYPRLLHKIQALRYILATASPKQCQNILVSLYSC